MAAVTALTDWLDGLEYIGPAKNQRNYRALGGSGGKPGTDRPRLIVIHTMEAPERDGMARQTAVWVRDSGGAAQVSCHFTVDNAEAIRCVSDTSVAFTQLTPWNDMSLSIEQAGYAGQSAGDWQDPFSVGQRRLVARIVAAWCQKWSIPAEYRTVDDLVDWRNVTGITTHYQLSLTSQRPELTSLGYKPGNHTDPGPNYPMDMLLAEVQMLLNATTPTPTEDDEMPLIMHDDLGNFFRVADSVRNVGNTEIAKLRALGVPEETQAATGWEAYNLRAAAGFDDSRNPKPA